MSCGHCREAEALFGPEKARADLKNYRRKGATGATRTLIDALAQDGVSDVTVLDIGGGVGAILHELLARGAMHGTQVDASPAYLEASREEGERRGHLDRLRFVSGDAVELGPLLMSADIVTLDKVLCCYPDMRALVHATAPLATRYYGLVYPRDTWWARIGLPLANVYLSLTKRCFRTYLHSPAEIDAAVRDEGLERRSVQRHFVWEVAIYVKTA